VFNFFKKSLKNGGAFNILSWLFVCLSIITLTTGCTSEPNTAPAVNTASAVNTAGRSGPLFTGDGGKNTKIAVLQPHGEGLAPDELWISAYIQGVLTSDFNKYTAMTVIDRQNLDKLIENQELSVSGYFSDDDYISIGNMLNAEYILIGSLRKIAQGGPFILDLAVSHAVTGRRVASFAPKNCTFRDIQNAAIIQDAFEDIAASWESVSQNMADKASWEQPIRKLPLKHPFQKASLPSRIGVSERLFPIITMRHPTLQPCPRLREEYQIYLHRYRAVL
jgi:TolB-like protein